MIQISVGHNNPEGTIRSKKFALLNKLNFSMRNYRVSKFSHLEVGPIQHEIIIGSMLGDLSAERNTPNSNTRLQFKQSIINKVYIEHLWNIFQMYCGSDPINLSYFDSRPNKNKEYKAIKFQTYSIACFNIYRELFYNSNGVKIIPATLSELLTSRGLAYWIMDDGYKFGKGLYISTDSYTKSDIERLVYILGIKFYLNSNLHKTTNGYRIYIHSDSMTKLNETIKPYFIEHFYYKSSTLSWK